MLRLLLLAFLLSACVPDMAITAAINLWNIAHHQEKHDADPD